MLIYPRTPWLTTQAVCFTLLLNSLSSSLTICPAGFMPPDCAHQCKDGHYGANCVSPCPSSCLNRSCRPQRGECYTCLPGFIGSKCSEQCPKGLFGQDCKQPCPIGCRDNGCDPFTGVCHQCLPGYSGTRCESFVSVSDNQALKHTTGEGIRTSDKNSMLYMIIVAVIFSLPGCLVPCWVCYFKKKTKPSKSDTTKKHIYKPLNTDDELQTNDSDKKGIQASHPNSNDVVEPKRARGNTRKPSTQSSNSPPSKTAKKTFGYYSVRTKSTADMQVETSFQNKDQLTDETLELGGFLNNFDHNKVLEENQALDVKKAANYTKNLYFKTQTKTPNLVSERSEKSGAQSNIRASHISKSGSAHGTEKNAGDNLSRSTRGEAGGEHPAPPTFAEQDDTDRQRALRKQASPAQSAHECRRTRQKGSFMTRFWSRISKVRALHQRASRSTQHNRTGRCLTSSYS